MDVSLLGAKQAYSTRQNWLSKELELEREDNWLGS